MPPAGSFDDQEEMRDDPRGQSQQPPPPPFVHNSIVKYTGRTYDTIRPEHLLVKDFPKNERDETRVTTTCS